jgi:hypothetical protein
MAAITPNTERFESVTAGGNCGGMVRIHYRKGLGLTRDVGDAALPNKYDFQCTHLLVVEIG